MASAAASTSSSRDTQLSKAMSYLLRHGAQKEGLQMTSDGFVKLDDLLRHRSMKGAKAEELVRIIENCPKKRFHLEHKLINDNHAASGGSSGESTSVAYVRANQGHSIAEVQVDSVKLTPNDNIEQCIHGTYLKFWDSIKTQGLSKMGRQHIHLSEDYPGSKEVISGMRASCNLAIYIDIKKAMNDGIEFFRSANNVILCPGDENGFLKPKYFSRVVNIKTNVCLDDYDK